MSQHDEDDLHEGISIKGYPSSELMKEGVSRREGI
jgi:hypothetical protein